MLKHFVEIAHVGSLVPESKEIPERNPELLKLPEGTYSFWFYDQEQVVLDNGEVLKGKKKNYSPRFFFGKAYTLLEIMQQFPNQTVLIEYMKLHRCERAIKTVAEHWSILEGCDMVIER